MEALLEVVQHIFELVLAHYLAYSIAAAVAAVGAVTWEWYRHRRHGFVRIYSRRVLKKHDPLERFVNKGHDRDEILMAGRTLRQIVKDRGDLIIDGVEKGMIITLLVLDPNRLEKVNFEALQIENARREITQDLRRSMRNLRTICDNLKNTQLAGKKVLGKLYVYGSTQLLMNSLVAYVRHRPRPRLLLLYNFSFGMDESKKFDFRFALRYDEESKDFSNQLYQSYKRLIANPETKLLLWGPPEESESQTAAEPDVSDSIRDEVKKFREYERIRNNSFKRFGGYAVDVFESLAGERALPPPVSVQLELTNTCSTHCSHCFRFTPTKSERPEMSTPMLKRLLDELANIDVRTITLSGGEPTAHPGFAEVLAHASQRGLKVGVLTNGVFDPQLAEVMAKEASWIRISMDGGTEETYNKIRKLPSGEGAYLEVIKSIKVLQGLVGQPGNNCQIGFCYTIQKGNSRLQDIKDMVEFVESLDLPPKVDYLTFKFVHGSNGFNSSEEAISKIYNEILCNPAYEKKANFAYLKRFLEQTSIASVATGRPIESMYLGQNVTCFTPYLFSLVDAYGDVYTCCHLYEDNGAYTSKFKEKRNKHLLGTYPDNSFAQIWRNAAYEKVREELKAIDPLSDCYAACGKCTRHFNHNIWLSRLYAQHQNPQAAEGIRNLLTRRDSDVWL